MKKIIITIGMVAAAAAGLTLSFRVKKTETVYNPFSKEGTAKVAEALNRDSDKDGLKDWEEELWKTDPHNPDTDGDGTPDGEEIKEGRNPLVKNTAPPGAPPNDRLDSETVQKKISKPAGPPTQTDSMTYTLFLHYLALRRQSGGKLTNEDVQALINEALATPEAASTTTFGEADVAVGGEGDEALREYANRLGEIIKTPPEGAPESEFSLLKSALESQDPSVLANLEKNAALYDRVLQNLRAMPAPREAAEIHLGLLNVFAGLRDDDRALKGLFSDPLRALPAIPRFQNEGEVLARALSDLRSLLKERGINFKPSESGYLVENMGI